MPTFHIRKRSKRAKGSQYYKDYSSRSNGTFCGLPPTDHDIKWNQKAEQFGEWIPCEGCVERRI